MMKSSYKGWNTRPTDRAFVQFIKTIKERNEENDDDFLLMCVGETGTGKSTLMIEGMELYNPDLNEDYIGLDPKDHATALKRASEYDGPRFCSSDEANVQKRNATTKYNKDLIDLYLAIRGTNIFHWWNNPSLDIIDKFFIQEKINAIIYIFTKDKYYPRLYYVFTKKSILKIFEKNKNKLTLKILKDSANKFAEYQGWFNKYDGPLWAAYTEKKKRRMVVKIDDFFTKYADDDKSTQVQAADKVGCHRVTINKRVKKLEEEDDWIQGEDYIRSGTKEYYLPAGIMKLKKFNKYKFDDELADTITTVKSSEIYTHATPTPINPLPIKEEEGDDSWL